MNPNESAPSPAVITPAMRSRAKEQPGSWLYLTHPAFEDAVEVPPHAIIGAYEVDEHGEVLPHFHANPDYRPDGQVEPTRLTSLPLELAVSFDGDSTFIANELVLALNETARNLAATSIGRRQAGLDFPQIAVVGHGVSYDSLAGARTESVGTTLAMQITYHLGAMQRDVAATARITVEDLAIDGLVAPHVPVGTVHVLVDYQAGNSGASVGVPVHSSALSR